MDVAVFGPLQQFHHQIWHILRQCAKVEDMPLLIYHSNGTAAEDA